MQHTMHNTLQRCFKNAIHTKIDHERNFSNLIPHLNHSYYRNIPAMRENVFILKGWILQHVIVSTPPEKKEAFETFLSRELSALHTNPDSEVCLAIIQYLKIIISLHDQTSDEKKMDIANALASEDYSKCLEGSSERLFNITQQYEDSDLLSRLLSLTQLFYPQQAGTFIRDKKLIPSAGNEIHMVTALMQYASQALDIPLQTISNEHVEAQRNDLNLKTIRDWRTHVIKAWDTEFLTFATDQIFPNTLAQSDPARVVVCNLFPSKLHDNTLYVVRKGESVTVSIRHKNTKEVSETITIKTILIDGELDTQQASPNGAYDSMLNYLVGSNYFKQKLINHLIVDQPELLPIPKENHLPYQFLLPDNANELLHYQGLDEQRPDSQRTRQALLLHAANTAHADATCRYLRGTQK